MPHDKPIQPLTAAHLQRRLAAKLVAAWRTLTHKPQGLVIVGWGCS